LDEALEAGNKKGKTLKELKDKNQKGSNAYRGKWKDMKPS
jgi:hypothetical protein